MEFIKGLLVGVALGAVAALLYAPKSGAETRAQLSSQATAELELAQARMHRGMESVQAELESVKAELEKLREKQEQEEEEIEELSEEEA